MWNSVDTQEHVVLQLCQLMTVTTDVLESSSSNCNCFLQSSVSRCGHSAAGPGARRHQLQETVLLG